jgi:SMC interacting uncharacterized protein involved in chromosome segregation
MLGRLGPRLGMRGFIKPNNVKVIEKSDLSFFETLTSELVSLKEKVKTRIAALDTYTREKKYDLMREIVRFETYFRGVQSYSQSHIEEAKTKNEFVQVVQNLKEIDRYLKESRKLLDSVGSTESEFAQKISSDIKVLENIFKKIKKIDAVE